MTFGMKLVVATYRIASQTVGDVSLAPEGRSSFLPRTKERVHAHRNRHRPLTFLCACLLCTGHLIALVVPYHSTIYCLRSVMCHCKSRRWMRTCALELMIGRQEVRWPVVRLKIGSAGKRSSSRVQGDLVVWHVQTRYHALSGSCGMLEACVLWCIAKTRSNAGPGASLCQCHCCAGRSCRRAM
jgi:hypothetical protein